MHTVFLPVAPPPGASDFLRHVRPGDLALREEARPIRRDRYLGLRAGGRADSARTLSGWPTAYTHVLIFCWSRIGNTLFVSGSDVVVFSAAEEALFSRVASRFGLGPKYLCVPVKVTDWWRILGLFAGLNG